VAPPHVGRMCSHPIGAEVLRTSPPFGRLFFSVESFDDPRSGGDIYRARRTPLFVPLFPCRHFVPISPRTSETCAGIPVRLLEFYSFPLEMSFCLRVRFLVSGGSLFFAVKKELAPFPVIFS